MYSCLVDDTHKEEQVRKINQQPRGDGRSGTNRYWKMFLKMIFDYPPSRINFDITAPYSYLF